MAMIGPIARTLISPRHLGSVCAESLLAGFAMLSGVCSQGKFTRNIPDHKSGPSLPRFGRGSCCCSIDCGRSLTRVL